MPRFAAVAVVLLTVIIAAGAAALWHGAWLPDVVRPGAASAPSSAERLGHEDPVERAAAAIKAHDVAAVRQYLARGGDPDGADGEGEVLLNKAVLLGTPEILEVLLAAGADPNLPGKNGLSPLAIAALAGRHAMLERLMTANAAENAAGALTGPDPGLAAAGAKAPERAAAAAGAPAAASAGNEPGRTETSSSPTGTSGTPSVLASLAGDGAPQAALTAEPHASMTGLLISPVARPAAGAPEVTSPTPDAAGPSPQPAPPAGGPGGAPTAAGAGAVAGDAPQAWVSAAQRRLGQLGYYKGPVTGFAGPLTADAVKRYQAVAGVPQDGIISADLLRRIGANIEAPGEATAPVARAAAAAPAPVPGQGGGQAPAANPGLQQVRNALGQEFNSAARPDALRQHCQVNANAWVHDEAIGRSLFCRDVIGSPPR